MKSLICTKKNKLMKYYISFSLACSLLESCGSSQEENPSSLEKNKRGPQNLEQNQNKDSIKFEIKNPQK